MLTLRYWLLCIVGIFLPNASFALNIVTTIKPVHSIVASITTGLYEPTLLIKQRVSAHHYQMRPSDRLAINQADKIYWIGTDIETTFYSILKDNDKAVSLANLDSIEKYPLRAILSRQSAKQKSSVRLDQHVWLDPSNALRMAEKIADDLIALDTKNKAQYQMNLANFTSDIVQLNSHIQSKISPVQQQPFASLHDAFQYYEKAYNLELTSRINLHPNLPLSGKQRLLIDQAIKEENINCIFYDPAHHPKAARQLALQDNIRLQAIDPTGAKETAGQAMYIEWLTLLTDEIVSCLAD